MPSQETYSLLELNQYIRRVISLNFDTPIWIECEIGQVSQSRGHFYLDLIQKEESQIVAQCQAAMWANVYFFLKRKSPVAPEDILQQGMSVKLKINVDYHERYGLKLIIEDIDSSFTIGQLELQRQAILKELREKDLIRKNASTHLPSVVQRLAVISSPKAAGYKDFVKHLQDNLYGYAISVTLFETAMQGQQVEAECIHALREISSDPTFFDAVAIIRGGGARTDLAAFDNLKLAITVARFPIPVLIGIGHETDQSVLDLVCYRSLKTPTAVADFIVEHNVQFETALEELSDAIKYEVQLRLRNAQDHLGQLSHSLQSGVRAKVNREFQRLQFARQQLVQSGKQRIVLHQSKLQSLEQLLDAIHPDHVLARGFTITSTGGKTLTSVAQAEKGAEIQTTFQDGFIKSIVE